MDENTRISLEFEANKKSVGLAYVLWFFLGGFGAHRFYLKQNGTGVAQLLLGVLGWVPLFLGWVVLGIWLLVDAFLIPGMVERQNSDLIRQLGGTPAERIDPATKGAARIV